MSLDQLQTQNLRPTDLIWVECQSWDWERVQEIPELKAILDGHSPAVSTSEKAQKPATKLKVSQTIFPDQQVVEPVNPVPMDNRQDTVKPTVQTDHLSDVRHKPEPLTDLKIAQTIFPDQHEELSPIPASSKRENQEKVPVKEPRPVLEPGVQLYKDGDFGTPDELIIEVSDPVQTKIEEKVPVPVMEQSFEANMYKYGGLTKTEGSETTSSTPSLANQGTANSKDDKASLQTNYTRSLDEIKEMYVRNMEERKKRDNKKFAISFPSNFKKVAVYIAFALGGGLLVMVIGRPSKSRDIANLPAKPATIEQSVTEKENETFTASMVDPVAAQPTATIQQEQLATIPTEYLPTPGVKPRENENPAVQQEEEKPVVSEPEPETVQIVPAKKTIAVADLREQVSVKPNNFTTGSFGGIRDLELVLQNNSRYVLDEVKVEIKYLNLDNITVNTDAVVFRSVHPGEPATLSVKKSRRGVKVRVKIVHIESRQASGHIAGN